MAKVTYQTRIHVITTRNVNGQVTATKLISMPANKDTLGLDCMGFHYNSHHESMLATAAKTHTTKKEAEKYHEELTRSLILLGSNR